jgi:uncharacterized membrane protein YidH (DUF202 family)
MKTSKYDNPEIERFQSLVEQGFLQGPELEAAGEAAAYRDGEVESVLRYEYFLTRRTLLEALGAFYGCAWVEYDERVPVPPDLLYGLDADRLCASGWFPAAREGEKLIIAASNPLDPVLREEVKGFLPAAEYEFRVALREDILFFIQDFLNDQPDHIVGNERTGLALWRNNMARWRTKMACYRTDYATTRTCLSALRGGLTLITIGTMLLRLRGASALAPLFPLLIVAGAGFVSLGLFSYFRIKKSVFRPPKPQTLIEVTAATMTFFDNYQFVVQTPTVDSMKSTMLCRLADILPNSCVFIEPSRDHKVRSALAHERTSLAAQRTVLGCYRTLFAMARTGLSFIRSGISFAGISVGLMEYFGLSWFSIVDVAVLVAGVAMAVDGVFWYWPVRKEHREAAKCGFIS